LKFDPIYDGSITALEDHRLVIRRRAHVPLWLLLSWIFVLQVFTIRAMRASPDLHDLIVASAATASILLALGTALGLFVFVLPGMALDRSLMPRVHRSLVIERTDGGAGGSPGFRVEVDGARLAPTSRRALFELRDELTNAHVLVIGTRAIAVQAFQWRHAADPAFDAESATKALLTGDRRMRASYSRRSLTPLVQALMRVLDLDPHRLGAFEAPPPRWPFTSPGTFASPEGTTSRIQRLSCEAGVQSVLTTALVVGAYLAAGSWHIAALFWLRASLPGMESWLFAVVSAAACFLPTVLLLYLAARWLYAKRLNDRARVMIENTPA
jgi:hypothetical protein